MGDFHKNENTGNSIIKKKHFKSSPPPIYPHQRLLKLSITSKGVPELRVPASVCLSAIVKKSVYWKEPRRQVQICLRRVFLPPPSPVMANIHPILAYDVPRTEYVGLPAKLRLNVGPALQPIAGSMPVIRLRRWPNTNLCHRVCCILYANTWHSTNAVSMLTHSLRRWPVIKTALGDCTVFSGCCIMLVML